MATTWSQQQKTQLKQRLYSVALRLFRDRGYEDTTVQQIAQRAGVAKGTFFNYFASKDQVLREWYRRLTLDAFERIEQRRFSSARQAIVTLLGALAAVAAAERQLCVMKVRSASLNEMLSDEEREMDTRLLAFFSEHIEAGKRRGELDPDLDGELFASVVLTMLTGTAREWGMSPAGFDIENVVRARIDFLFRAAARQ